MADIVKKSLYTEEQWIETKEALINKPNLSIKEISRLVGIPVHIIESRAAKEGWLTRRDMMGARADIENLNRIIREVAYQVNDVHQHTGALIESLQYAHKIKIVFDQDGNMHYENFNEFPGKPSKEDWEKMSSAEKSAMLKYISPSRLERFMTDLLKVFQLKSEVLEFVTKLSKGGLPKIDPRAIDISRREKDNKILDDPSVKLFADEEVDDDTTA